MTTITQFRSTDRSTANACNWQEAADLIQRATTLCPQNPKSALHAADIKRMSELVASYTATARRKANQVAFSTEIEALAMLARIRLISSEELTYKQAGDLIIRLAREITFERQTGKNANLA